MAIQLFFLFRAFSLFISLSCHILFYFFSSISLPFLLNSDPQTRRRFSFKWEDEHTTNMPCLQLIRRRKKKKKKEQLVQIVEKGENEDERIMMKGGKNEEDHENEEDDDNVESSLIGCSPLTRRRRKSAAVGKSRILDSGFARL